MRRWSALRCQRDYRVEGITRELLSIRPKVLQNGIPFGINVELNVPDLMCVDILLLKELERILDCDYGAPFWVEDVTTGPAPSQFPIGWTS